MTDLWPVWEKAVARRAMPTSQNRDMGHPRRWWDGAWSAEGLSSGERAVLRFEGSLDTDPSHGAKDGPPGILWLKGASGAAGPSTSLRFATLRYASLRMTIPRQVE